MLLESSTCLSPLAVFLRFLFRFPLHQQEIKASNQKKNRCRSMWREWNENCYVNMVSRWNVKQINCIVWFYSSSNKNAMIFYTFYLVHQLGVCVCVFFLIAALLYESNINKVLISQKFHIFEIQWRFDLIILRLRTAPKNKYYAIS